MAAKRWKYRPENGSVTHATWPLAMFVVSLLAVGCTQSACPIKHQTNRPISPSSVEKPVPVEPGPTVSYPDIPEVPEQLLGPSPPMTNDSLE